MLVSTRDIEKEPYHYDEAVLQGLAADGGLITPQDLPVMSEAEIHALDGQPYEMQFSHVHGLLAGEALTRRALHELALEAYDTKHFSRSEEGYITPVEQLFDDIYTLDLSRGETLAFKDMALQPVGLEMDRFLAARGGELTILGATSGDTGSAAAAAVRRTERLRLFMLSPQRGMAPVQTGQMGALTDWERIFNLSIAGNFDDCQNIVKTISQMPEFAHLGAMNSINYGRIAAQVPYSFAGYLQTIRLAGLPMGSLIDVYVPSGNFGNALSVHYARRMGLPIRNIILATNENDVLDRLVQTGAYQRQDVEKTTSPSMDIGESSNYERLVYEIMGGSAKWCAQYMKQFKERGAVSFSEYGIDKDVLRQMGFNSGRSTHRDRIRAIRLVINRTARVIDPHTADGVAVASRTASDGVPKLVYSTAKPDKFEKTIKEALGEDLMPRRDPRLVDIEERGKDGFVRLPNNVEAVAEYLLEHAA